MSRTPRLYAPDLPAAGRARLSDDEGAHLVRVLRARAGDAARLFDGKGREVECVVVDVGKHGVVVEIGREVAAPRPARYVVLVTSVPRGERMEWLVEKTVEAGVGAIAPLAADRSVRKDAGPNSLRRWRRAAVEAAKQCGRAAVPEICGPMALAHAIEATKDVVRFVATPEASARLADLVVGVQSVALFIGPEGGFAADETAALAAAGALPFGLGSLILRVETAAVVAVHLAST